MCLHKQGYCRRQVPQGDSAVRKERTKRRDADNIQSSAKFILDALKSCGVIKDDSRRYVTQVYHKIVDADADGVDVILKEA